MHAIDEDSSMPLPHLERHTVEYVYIDASTPRSDASTPPVKRHNSRAEEVFQKNIVGILNKRGYNVRDSLTSCASGLSLLLDQNETSDTSTASMTSSTSSISSVLLGLREPNHGQGPLHIAIRKGDLQVLDALLEHECADEIVNMQDNNGNTPLHFAAGSWRRPQCAAMVTQLLNAGADVQIKNKRALTALAVHVLTIKVDKPLVMAKLLEFGSDPNTEVDNESLLHIAIRHDLAQLCGVLVAFGASMAALNQDGLMCYEKAPPRIRRMMVRSIKRAPPFLPISQRSKCMRCTASLLSPKQVMSNFFKRLLGMRIPTHQCNCYHCGLLFCSQCLKHTQVADVLPASFTRSRMDDLSSVKTCPLCEGVLQERLQKLQARQSLDVRNNMLFSAAA